MKKLLVLLIPICFIACKNDANISVGKNLKEDSTSFQFKQFEEEEPILLREIEPSNTYPYFSKGRWRYVNTDKELLLNEFFEKAGFFHEGHAYVVKEGKYGVIDLKGNYVIPCEHDGARNVEHGLIPLKKNFLWGFADTSGKVMIPFLYENFTFRDDGTIHVEQNDQWGMIDYSGKQLILPLYDQDFKFEKGIAVVRRKYKYGLIDETGKMLVECNYRSLERINDSLFVASIKRRKSDSYYGVLNSRDEQVIDLIYKDIKILPGIGLIASHASSAGILRFNGDTLIAFSYEKLDGGSSNLIAARKYKKSGFISLENDTVIPFKYDKCRPFKGGRAAVMKSKWGVVDGKGEVIVPMIYQNVDIVSSNLIVAKRDYYTYLLLDSMGNKHHDIVFDNYQYGEMEDYTGGFEHEILFTQMKNGTMIVGKEGRIGMVDQNGKFVVPMDYHHLEPMNEYGFTVGTFWNKKAMVKYGDGQITPFMFDNLYWDYEVNRYYSKPLVENKQSDRHWPNKFRAGYLGPDGTYYGDMSDLSAIQPIEDYIMEIRKAYKRIQKKSKQREYTTRVFDDGSLKGKYSEEKFVVTDEPNKMRYEYYFDQKLSAYGPFFIYVIDSKDGKRENRYYFIHGKIIRWLDEEKIMQLVSDARFAPENDVHYKARQHLADFENQEALDHEEVNKLVASIDQLCKEINSDISSGKYKKGDSHSVGMGEYQEGSETYLDDNENLIYGYSYSTDEGGATYTRNYYQNGQSLREESDENFDELSEGDLAPHWTAGQYKTTSYFHQGELIRSIVEGNGITKIYDKVD